MNSIVKLSALVAVFAASAAIASADTIQIGSYASNSPSSMGNANSSVTYYNPWYGVSAPVPPPGIVPYTGDGFAGFTTQIGVPTGPESTWQLNNVTPTWVAALPNSQWVSFGKTGPDTPAIDQPGDHYASNGNYYFQTTFSITPGQYTGYLNLLADDTAVVFLNGVQQNIPTDPGSFKHCSDGVPDCMVPTLITLNSADFNANGLNNVLTFQVVQGNSSDFGFDFAGSVSSVPEPGTLLMIGTGLLGSAGALFRRMHP
jgi:hypothetical protein